MKPSSKWRDEFCNQTIVSIRGNIVEEFVKDIQRDASRLPVEALEWLLRNVIEEIPEEKRTPEMQDSVNNALNVMMGEKVL